MKNNNINRISKSDFYEYLICHPEVLDDMEKVIKIKNIVISNNYIRQKNIENNSKIGFSNMPMIAFLSFLAQLTFLTIFYLFLK